MEITIRCSPIISCIDWLLAAVTRGRGADYSRGFGSSNSAHKLSCRKPTEQAKKDRKEWRLEQDQQEAYNRIQERKTRNIEREWRGDEGQTLSLSAQSAGIK